MHIELTVADHQANGCIALARWAVLSIDQGREILAAIDAAIPDEAAGNVKTDPFNFILDQTIGPGEMIDTNQKPIPLQFAMRLAPDQIEQWLKDRPDPDAVFGTEPETLPGLPGLN